MNNTRDFFFGMLTFAFMAVCSLLAYFLLTPEQEPVHVLKELDKKLSKVDTVYVEEIPCNNDVCLLKRGEFNYKPEVRPFVRDLHYMLTVDTNYTYIDEHRIKGNNYYLHFGFYYVELWRPKDVTLNEEEAKLIRPIHEVYWQIERHRKAQELKSLRLR